MTPSRPVTLHPGRLTVCAFTGFEPFAFFQKGELVGFDVEIIEQFAAETGLDVDWRPTAKFQDLWLRPGRGECDLATAGIAAFDERRHASVAWSIPYFEVDRSILIHRSRATELQTIDDFAGHILAFVGGSAADLDTRERAPAQTRLLAIEDQAQGMAILRAGEVDGLAMGAPSNAYNHQLHPDFVLTDVHQFSQSEALRFPVNAANPSLLSALNTYIEHAADDGSLRDTIARWLHEGSVL